MTSATRDEHPGKDATVRQRLDWLADDLIRQSRLVDYADEKVKLRYQAYGVWLAIDELFGAAS